jgi:hypothetical protein
MLAAMPDAPASSASTRKSWLTPIWIALALAVILIVVLSVNSELTLREMNRWNETGVYPFELTRWTRFRISLGAFWARFWWLFGPFILCAFPGAAALYRLVRYDSAR